MKHPRRWTSTVAVATVTAAICLPSDAAVTETAPPKALSTGEVVASDCPPPQPATAVLLLSE